MHISEPPTQLVYAPAVKRYSFGVFIQLPLKSFDIVMNEGGGGQLSQTTQSNGTEGSVPNTSILLHLVPVKKCTKSASYLLCDISGTVMTV